VDINQAMSFLATAERSEARDHAFGDSEVFWQIGSDEVATGYFGSQSAEVSIQSSGDVSRFSGDAARELRNIGILKGVSRNDMTGPDEYKEGHVMPGLSLEDVRQELWPD